MHVRELQLDQRRNPRLALVNQGSSGIGDPL
jgi:hypothetical protein